MLGGSRKCAVTKLKQLGEQSRQVVKFHETVPCDINTRETYSNLKATSIRTVLSRHVVVVTRIEKDHKIELLLLQASAVAHRQEYCGAVYIFLLPLSRPVPTIHGGSYAL